MVYGQKIVSGYRYSLQGNDMMHKREWRTPRLAGRIPFIQGENTALYDTGLFALCFIQGEKPGAYLSYRAKTPLSYAREGTNFPCLRPFIGGRWAWALFLSLTVLVVRFAAFRIADTPVESCIQETACGADERRQQDEGKRPRRSHDRNGIGEALPACAVERSVLSSPEERSEPHKMERTLKLV